MHFKLQKNDGIFILGWTIHLRSFKHNRTVCMWSQFLWIQDRRISNNILATEERGRGSNIEKKGERFFSLKQSPPYRFIPMASSYSHRNKRTIHLIFDLLLLASLFFCTLVFTLFSSHFYFSVFITSSPFFSPFKQYARFKIIITYTT